jgi:hypothetical protein
MVLGWTQPLTETSTRNLPRGKGRPAHKADNLWADCIENMGYSTSHNPVGSTPVTGVDLPFSLQ